MQSAKSAIFFVSLNFLFQNFCFALSIFSFLCCEACSLSTSSFGIGKQLLSYSHIEPAA